MQNQEKLYRAQRDHMDRDLERGGRQRVHESWFRVDTVDYWRHERMYRSISPIAAHYRDKRWLSIGDGRYGLDAHRLGKMFGLSVFPTDISGALLKRGEELGLIEGHSEENAESLSFADNAFDVVFCKESYHHFPRPMVALYEMIRVASSAVVLIEPNEPLALQHPKSMLKQIATRLLPWGKSRSALSIMRSAQHEYEDCGNYLYRLSRAEIEKVVAALDLQGMAWRGLNDSYVEGCEFEPAVPGNKVFQQVKRAIAQSDLKCRFLPAFRDWDMITAVIFKDPIHPDLKGAMESAGYVFPATPRNPHVV